MQTVLRTAIEDTIKELGLPEADFVIEHPADMSHGDYACNIAMVLAKQVGKAPREIAEQFLAALDGQIEYVSKIEIAGPGFLNFYLHRDFFAGEVSRIKSLSDAWGHNDDQTGEVVAIEYTSPNLFKPLHIGNLVGNIIGESFSRLFTVAGASVTRFNYPSDIGLTVAKGVWGLKKTGGDPDNIEAIGKAYRVGNEFYEKEGEEAEEIKAINKALYENSDKELTALREAGIKTSKRHLRQLLDKLGTTFDKEITESQASEPGAKLVHEHVGDVFNESDGAVIYDGERSGLHTRVFINSSGLPTYEAKDVGNFELKNEALPNWTRSIVVTGVEQAEYFKVIFAAIKELFQEAADKELEHIPTGFLTLTTGKMSSRKGNVLTGESLLADMEAAAREHASESDDPKAVEQVAVAALKYQILRHNVGSNIVFDKEKALSFEGDSGPYLQYTHARICSVLEKAEAAGVTPSVATLPEETYEVEKWLYQFPEMVKEALDERAPHIVTTYLTKLAGSFNSFYVAEKIADASDEYAPYKAAIADAVRQTLQNGLWVLGIEAPERM